ncbi:efflux transporter periplasmic adaptor subunit, partial [Salmonella enterica subsp. enterica]|nr:efflux transporter periplasmic adaptor subunit [Salmonella enterica subsp. enterica serovar Enteritidis]
NVTHEGASEDVLAIPQSAVLDENGKKSVWVVDAPSATVNLKPVELEPGLAGMAVVKSGVEAGARIVTAGIHSLKPGQKIKIDGGL